MPDHDTSPLFSDPPPAESENVTEVTDPAVASVASWFQGRSPLEKIFGEIFRQSIDEVLDGQRTGRFDVDSLEKTEKTYLGTKVEILCRATLDLARGQEMDFIIDGHEVDAKFSMASPFGWSIPTEAAGKICLVMHADDKKGYFSTGLVRVTEEILNPGKNKDGKRTIQKAHRNKIYWLVRHGKLPENLLLNLSPEMRNKIFNTTKPRGAGNGGQGRVNQLFRLVQNHIIRREALLTVAQQDDGPKRARDARNHLRSEGIIILGHQNHHPRIASDLNLPVPSKGEWISIRIVPHGGNDSQPVTIIDGNAYTVASPHNASAPAPAKY